MNLPGEIEVDWVFAVSLSLWRFLLNHLSAVVYFIPNKLATASFSLRVGYSLLEYSWFRTNFWYWVILRIGEDSWEGKESNKDGIVFKFMRTVLKKELPFLNTHIIRGYRTSWNFRVSFIFA